MTNDDDDDISGVPEPSRADWIMAQQLGGTQNAAAIAAEFARLRAELSPEPCDHRPGYLHWIGNDLVGRALIWCRCGAIAVATGHPAARLPLGEPVLLHDGRLKPMDLHWTLPGTLPSAREDQRTVMGATVSAQAEKAFGEALEAGGVLAKGNPET